MGFGIADIMYASLRGFEGQLVQAALAMYGY